MQLFGVLDAKMFPFRLAVLSKFAIAPPVGELTSALLPENVLFVTVSVAGIGAGTASKSDKLAIAPPRPGLR